MGWGEKFTDQLSPEMPLSRRIRFSARESEDGWLPTFLGA
jgi:hypothetical protein